MKSKKTIGLFLILLAISFVGCNDKNEEYTDVTLEETYVRVLYSHTHSIRIQGGSGEYIPTIDRPEIADVEIEQTDDGAETILRIQTKEGGEAFITVTDKKSGKTAKCTLFVSKDGIPVTEIRYGVEADQPEAILVNLNEQEPYPIGSRFVPVPFSMTVGTTGEWTVLGTDWKEADNGRYTVTEVKGTIPEVFLRLIPIEAQFITWCTCQVDLGSKEHLYHMIMVQVPGAIGNDAPTYADVYFYEDLTDHYKTEYPDAGVNAVVRAYISSW